MPRSAKDILRVDEQKKCEEIEGYIRRWVDESGAGGVIMGLSGGVDSALLAAFAVRALGRDKVHAWFLHDKNSEKDSLDKARLVAKWLGLELNVGSISDAMREKEKEASFFKFLTLMPRFMLPLISSLYYIFIGESPYITVLRKNEIRKSGVKRWVYDHVMKGVEEMFDGPCAQRRVVILRLAKDKNLLLIGSGNRSEDLTGWFTPDGIDNMPCSPLNCLYKTQVRQMAEHLGVPDAVLKRKPSADVLKGADDALALGMNFDKIDLILYGIENNLSDNNMIEYGLAASEIRKVRNIHRLSEWRRRIS